MRYFVTAIGTDSGKTLASAILVEALGADYWKPIQAGTPTDSDTIRNLVSPKRVIHQEQYFLKSPMSPHAAAKIDNVEIKIKHLSAPHTTKPLIIEGAGGLLVPVNDQETIADMIPHFQSEIILVSNIYLGSINHSLLSLELIKSRGYHLKGIIFNGPKNLETQQIIQNYAGVKCLLHIRNEKKITKEVVNEYAQKLKANWNELAGQR
ncbi:dethiobiotin synthase [Fulvivirga kasyanovii]|uniref:ATP-dependent dethiobiotin synthetase BioD n=1 Tax=Fulvivirga kasyanovii TaxID=396812 RepID=A0ABW9RN45_9BACT|nr:dethiobiotin synthase [Fulvivirga kasyanovii]MTI25341.1 dethiobiotin synthase [Fulvivirga kasyanovii]